MVVVHKHIYELYSIKMNIINTLKPLIYDSTVGYLYTKNAIQHMLSSIPDNSKILDVGIGTGYTYTKNADLIKSKNITIVGVDIDASYVKYAKHAMIDYELDDNIRVIKGDIYEVKLDVGTFDYVIFSDSYAVIPNVHEMCTFCEKFLNPTGKMMVISTLFEEYNSTVNWLKERIIMLTTIDFGRMMIKPKLLQYIVERGCKEDDYSFKVIDTLHVPIYGPLLNTYMVQWSPAAKTKSSNTKQQTSKKK
jgi:ubiquinone/menaquinone biosynthesis C-methylase UbiE